MTKLYYEIAKDIEGEWHWMLWSGNGKQLAQNVKPYKRRTDVIAAIKSVQKTGDARIVFVHPKEDEQPSDVSTDAECSTPDQTDHEPSTPPQNDSPDDTENC